MTFFEDAQQDTSDPPVSSQNMTEENPDENDMTEDIPDENLDPIHQDFINLRRKNPGKFIMSHININSLQYKHEEVSLILKRNLVDCLFVSETKLNESHPLANFQVENYRTY